MLYGNFDVDYCSEVHHAKTLTALGHDVIRLQENRVSADVVLSESLNADMLVWVHTHSFVNTGRPMDEVLVELRRRHIPTVAYHLDLYMGLRRWREYQNSPYMKVQHFFTCDRLMAEWFNANTDTTGHYLPAGVFEPECYLATPGERFDVAFVGSKGYHSEWPYRPQLINWLADTYGDRFRHYGGGGRATVRGAELNQVYADARVVVGDSLCLGYGYPDYWSDRVYETLGRGGFLIHPYVSGMERHFSDGKHLHFYAYNDFAELRHLIDYYLSYPDEADDIRRAGHEHVKAHHTYRDRWTEILDAVA
ncbi:glycosyltransferase [Nocardia sp. NPDC057030]|uniref:glycosyltransferase family protein n=1 Tax=unclassified Nocardia TaxID=2637762 RepID=UPI003634CB37